MSSGSKVVDGRLDPVGYQRITPTASIGFTVPTNARIAVIVVSNQVVRWRDDGVAPSATVGMPLAVGQQFTYNGDLHAIRFIEAVSGAVLDVSYYR